MPTSWLVSLSGLINRGVPSEEAVRGALPLLRDGLGASDAYLIYGDGASFERYGTSAELELDQAALSTVHRDLTSRKQPCAFNVRDARVVDVRPATSRKPSDYVGTLIPMGTMGEMLLVKGPWARGLGAWRLRSLQTALPTLALIMEQRLDAKRAERQRDQLTALANITRVLSESADLETVLSGMAGTITTTTGVDYVSIDLVDAEGKVTLRCFNSSRPGVEAFRERWKQGAGRPDEVRATVLRTREPTLVPDAPNDARLPEAVRNFAARTLTRSIATFPLLTKDEVLGVITVASHRPLEFSKEQVELLEGLASQVATAVKGISLYQELAASRRQLQRLNEQLRESMGIQHHLARTDPLTGIPNRRYVEEALEAECARAIRYGQPLSVVMADLDSLKVVNDRYSHARGDDVLRYMTRVARETCRQADMVGRYGGDEVVFVLPATGLPEAAAFSERFRTRLADNPATYGADEAIPITVSLGVAEWDKESMKSPTCLIDRADRAMYAAKDAGRNRTMLAVGNEARAA